MTSGATGRSPCERDSVSCMTIHMVRVLERAESSTTTVTIEMLEHARPGSTTYIRHAHYQLAMTCKGPALGIVKTVERHNGVEVWPRLFQRSEPDACKTIAKHGDANPHSPCKTMRKHKLCFCRKLLRDNVATCEQWRCSYACKSNSQLNTPPRQGRPHADIDTFA